MTWLRVGSDSTPSPVLHFFANRRNSCPASLSRAGKFRSPNTTVTEAIKGGPFIRFGNFEVNVRSGELLRDGERLRLPAQSFQILVMLLENPGEVVTRQEIQTRLWPSDTVVEFENSISAAVKRLRGALEDSAEQPRYVETLARRGYRWIGPVELAEPKAEMMRAPAPRKARWKILVAATIVAVLILAIAWRRSGSHVSAARLTAKDTVVLAEFANSTGDSIFDDTLRPALRSSLGQSPFLNILSDNRTNLALRLMTKPAGTRLTPEIARDICRREQSKAYIQGAIAALGSEYVIGLKAVNCVNGTTLAEQQVTAQDKKEVLKLLGNAASKLREQLGESLASVAKFDIPFDQTTSSLEALREYELGMTTVDQDTASSLPHFLRAIQIDPEFAMAYLSAAETYENMNQSARANEYFTKAFQLRDHADPRERLEIESLYYGEVTGELEKAAQSYRKTIESYPKSSPSPYGNLSLVYAQMGDYEKALDLAREVLRRYPAFGGEAYEGIAEDLLPLQRYDEARQILQQAVERKIDIDGVHKDLYGLGFVTGDSRLVAEQAAWLENKPEYANVGFALESDSAAYRGQLRRARVLTDRSAEAAMRIDNKEAAALWRGNAALREAMFGNASMAQKYAQEALKGVPGSQHVEILAALAFGMAGDGARAHSLAHELSKRFPLDTQVQAVWLPTIHAQLALLQKKPETALNVLNSLSSTELGEVPFSLSVSCLYPSYLRGEAYLGQGNGNLAANEFQKIVDHKGIVWNCPTGALGHLGLGRANDLQTRTVHGVEADAARSRSRQAYQDFLNLWKDADPDIPIYKQAKAEYAKLQ